MGESGRSGIGKSGDARATDCTCLRRSPPLAAAGIAWLQYHHYPRPDLAFTRLPIPWVTLVIKLGARDRWHRLDGDWHSFPRLGLRGHTVERTEGRDDSDGPNEYLSALVEPWAVESLFGIPARLVRDDVIDVETLWDGEARLLAEQLACLDTPQAKLDLLERQLLGRSWPSRECDPLARRFILLCRAHAGGAKVERLCREMGMSERRFRQVFNDAIGVSPKRWARLERFSAALRALHPTSWGADDDFAQPDYFDQAHAINEFRQHAGMTPQVYRRLKANGDPRVFMIAAHEAPAPL